MVNDEMKHQPLIDCAKTFGTPTYFYFAKQIQAQAHYLEALIKAGCRIHYSIKANPTLAILHLVKQLGLSCEVSSEMELSSALFAGFNAKDIIFVGPGKTEKEIKYAIKQSIRYIICESIAELLMIEEVSKVYQKKTRVLLRINPDFVLKQSAMRMSGAASQFGIDLTTLEQARHTLKKLVHTKICGIQVYSGTRILDIDSILENTKNILLLGNEISKRFKLKIRVIDIGGGIGVPYFSGERDIDKNALFLQLSTLIAAYKKQFYYREIIVELGRFLLAESGYLITKVIALKNSHGKKYVIIDGGMHCNHAVSVHGAMIHRNFPVYKINHSNVKKKNIIYQIAGPSCSPGDLISRDLVLPEVKIGDLLAFGMVGAYGLTASPGRFISHGFPAEVLYHYKKMSLIRRRESIDDLLKTQKNL